MFRLALAERLHMTLAALDSSVTEWELLLWAAKWEIDGLIQRRQERVKGLSYGQALDMVRADYRSMMQRKGKAE